MKITFCFEYHSMIACDLNDLKKPTFDSLKKFSVALYDLCLSAPGLDFWPVASVLIYIFQKGGQDGSAASDAAWGAI